MNKVSIVEDFEHPHQSKLAKPLTQLKTPKQRIPQGFLHQKLVVLPPGVTQNIEKHPITSTLFVRDIGYFPHAKHHYFERPQGAISNIVIFCTQGSGTIELLEDATNRNAEPLNDTKISGCSETDYSAKDSTAITIKQHQLAIVPRHTSHRYYASEYDPWSIYWMHLDGTSADAFVRYITKAGQPLVVTPQGQQAIEHTMGSILESLQKGYSIDHCIQITSELFSLFALLGIGFGAGSTHQYGRVEAMGQNPVQKAIQLMSHRLNSFITLNQLVDELHLSKSRIIELFKEQTGFTPIDYFIHMKMQYACQELDMSGLSIKAIALNLGYDDQYYFSRIFKKVVGASPSEYRKVAKG